MDPVIVIAAFKITGALLGGILGVIGVLFNFKRPDNHITGWGVAVLVGIIASAAAGVIGSIAEGYKAKSEASLQAARTEQLLKELSRAIQPITQLEITYWVTLASEAPRLRAYLGRVSKAIEAQKDRLRRTTFPGDNGIHVTASAADDEPLNIDLGLRSALWPRGKEPPVGDMALSFHLNVFIRKSPIAPEDFYPLIGIDPRSADWIATTFPPLNRKRNRLIFDRRAGGIEIFGTTEFPKAFWHSNGKITSVPDLYGAQLLLVPPHAWDIKLPQRFQQYDRPEMAELSRMLDLKTIVLKFREGRDIWINGRAFTKTKFKHGYPVFSIVLPPDDPGFQKLLPQE